MKRAVFLDRDGVLNEAIVREGKPFSPRSLSEVIVPKDVQTALNTLKSAGFLLIGATNQPDVARGTVPRSVVEAIHAFLMAELPLDEIRVCYHDGPGCSCRKPLPGMLTQAAAEHKIDLSQSIMIGDRWKDIEAGKNAGCKTIWLCRDYSEPKPPRPADFIAYSLTEAAQWAIMQTALCQK